MGLERFLRKGRLAESLHASLAVPKSAVFSSVFANYGGLLLVQNDLVGAELWVSFGVSNVLFRSLFGFFLCDLDWLVAGWLWLAGCLAGWLAVRLAGCLAAWTVDSLSSSHATRGSAGLLL